MSPTRSKRSPSGAAWDAPRLRRAAASVLSTGLKAVDPVQLVSRHLRLDGHRLRIAGQTYRLGRGRVAVVAAGKAAALMAATAERILGQHLWRGLAVDVAHSKALQKTRLYVAGHPIPDARGLEAAAAVEELAGNLNREDLLLLLLSGGASALLPAPVPGVSLAQKALTTRLLLNAGATIQELNTVRKHLSRLKGGGLARAAAPAAVAALLLSDVVGDDEAVIASGPAAPDPTTFADALEVLTRHGLRKAVPGAVLRHLEAGARGALPETPKPGQALFTRVTNRVIGSNRLALAAAAAAARRLGLRPLILTTRLEGEARAAGRLLAAILRECVESGTPGRPPVCLLAGGETTVTVRGDGRGGRNQELVLAAAESLAGFPVPAVVASLGTDGIDGASEAAGGVADQRTCSRAAGLGLAPAGSFLEENDSEAFLAALGDLIITGPTGTNVADLTLLAAGQSAQSSRRRSQL